MRDPNRITPTIRQIEALWYKYPDMRLCQLLSMIAHKSGWKDNDLFYLEDEQLLEGIKEIGE